MNEIQIEGDINKSFDWLQNNAQEYFKKGLYAAANVIKEQARQNLSSNLPAANHQNPKYSDTLLDAIRNTSTQGDFIIVHTLGTRDSKSGTYRTRFFENELKAGTRYQKSYKGIPLKKKRFLGRLPALKFFSSAVTSKGEEATRVIENAVNRLIDEANK